MQLIRLLLEQHPQTQHQFFSVTDFWSAGCTTSTFPPASPNIIVFSELYLSHGHQYILSSVVIFLLKHLLKIGYIFLAPLKITSKKTTQNISFQIIVISSVFGFYLTMVYGKRSTLLAADPLRNWCKCTSPWVCSDDLSVFSRSFLSPTNLPCGTCKSIITLSSSEGRLFSPAKPIRKHNAVTYLSADPKMYMQWGEKNTAHILQRWTLWWRYSLACLCDKYITCVWGRAPHICTWNTANRTSGQ